MTFGQSWGALKKSWRQLKLSMKIGDFERVDQLKERIFYIRASMGSENEELY